MTPEVASECGFTPVFLKDGYEDWFFHGKPLSEKIFKDFPADKSEYAVFTGNAEECKDSKNCKFVGMVERKGRFLKYGFVINDFYCDEDTSFTPCCSAHFDPVRSFLQEGRDRH